MSDIVTYYDSIADDYGDRYDPDQLMALTDYPAEYFRLQMLKRRIKECAIESVYDIGCGDGIPLMQIAKMGVKVAGCDASLQMAKKARALFDAASLDAECIMHLELRPGMWLPVENFHAWQGVVAFGVLPHIKDDAWFLSLLKQFLRPGGRCFIEFRNSLFSLFSFNRFTKKFILDDLLKDLDPILKSVVAIELEHRTDGNEPPQRTFDDIARFHNPFELVDAFRQNGFTEVNIHWYHFHPTMPYLEVYCNPAWRRAAMEMEGKLEHDWRGNFLCSAGVVEAVKP